MEKIKCKICGKECKSYVGLQSHVVQSHGLKSKEYYDKYLKKDQNEGHCLTCGKQTKFYSITHGYAKYCCRNCADKDPQKHLKAKKTMLDRYGPDYKKEIYVNRSKKTKKERYGDENYNNVEKNKETCLKRYGVDNIRKSKEYIEHCKQVKLEKYGDENYNNREKCRETCLDKYGGIGFASEELRRKGRATCKKRYGFEIAMQHPDIAKKVSEKQIANAKERIAKAKETNLRIYGVEYVGQSEKVKEKIKQNNLEKYGVEYSWQAEEVKEKIKETNQERYGVDWAISSPEIQKRGFKTREQNGNQSKTEIYFKEKCDELSFNYIEQYYDNRYPFNCDFYFPENDLFVEINDHWTHNNHWFNESNEDDLKQLEKWEKGNTQYYRNAITTWTIRDVEKREFSKKSNLNYVVLWSLNDIDSWFSLGCPIGHDWKKEHTWQK